jgi:hypothetical protein
MKRSRINVSMTIKTSPTVTAHRNGFPKKAAPFPHLNPVLGGTPWVEEVTIMFFTVAA